MQQVSQPTATHAAPSGRDLFHSERPDTNTIAALRDVLLARAALAREDPVAFFNFVMVEESTQLPIRCLPHQEVMLDFMHFHERFVFLIPPGFAKSYCFVGYTLFLLGRDPTARGAIVGASQDQSNKLVSAVRDYIDKSERLRLVFPHLRRSTREGDAWTQTQLIVERPAGIRQPSLVSYGIDSGSIFGSRLSFVFCDDVLNDDNTLTAEARAKVRTKLDQKVLTRLDPTGAKVGFGNTAWHPDDVVHAAVKKGWATLKMTVYGDIHVQDDAERMLANLPEWDSPRIRLAHPNEKNPCRLTAHDSPAHDTACQVPLWPGRYPLERIEKIRREQVLPKVFNQMYLSDCRDDGSSLCKEEFVEACHRTAERLGVYGFVHKYDGPDPVFIGVDLAFEPGEEHDENAIFVFSPRPDGFNVILHIEIGQWDAPTTMDKILSCAQRYKNSVITVESNGGQKMLKDFVLKKSASCPVKSHTTTQAKARPWSGIPAIITEMMNGAWAFPRGRRGELHPFMKKLVDACLYYTPQRHTDDVLMAMYFARDQARQWGALGVRDVDNDGADPASKLAGRVLMR